MLVDRLAEQIKVPRDGTVIDATVGHGGHSLLFGGALGPDGLLLGLDVDEGCIERARTRLSSLACRIVLVRENFRRIAETAAACRIRKADLIFADLGFCSGQLGESQRGLSFQENMPLDMRLDDRLDQTAADIVNGYDEKSLADLIFQYGEDRASRRIARFIVQSRSGRRIETTGELAAIISRALGQGGRGHRYRIHPATRTFQALRIAVNDELGALTALLSVGSGLLNPGGLIAVISFHSLEDRIVKLDFREKAAKGIYEILTKKPMTAAEDEVKQNPRARSAKLRIARLRMS
ncbi:MAG: 16S rRNA (cytosine(1402)-N(4))-methyltransferase RsmH [Phycisphaerae bacterium]|nr:16S rRNA (cytosine(1402)-N(4))-methyltransferase RsmH [Phycisphaerae bacterium]